MASDPNPLGADDTVFIHAMGTVVLDFTEDQENIGIYVDLIRDRISRVNRSHPIVGRLAAAADNMFFMAELEKTTTRRKAVYSDGRWHAERALQAYFRWRLEKTLGHLEAQATPQEEDAA